MRLKNIVTAAAAAILLLPGAALAQSTRMLSADKTNDYGLVYTLPATAVCVEIDVKHTIRKAGPFYQFAKKYIGTSNAVGEDSETWEITAARLSTFGVPNDTAAYRMQLKPGVLTQICVSDDGMLLSVNKKSDAPKALPESRLQSAITARSPEAYLKYTNEDFMAAQSAAKRAQLLSESLIEAKEARLELTRGTADNMPADGEQMKLLLQELENQERAITEAFTGTEVSESLTGVFYLLPDEDGVYDLIRLSDFGGFVETDDFSGELVELVVGEFSKVETPTGPDGLPKKLPKDALIYTIPAKANVAVRFRGRNLVSKDFDFGQFGTTFGLAPALFTDKKAPSYVIFDPATGAIRRLGLLSDEE